MLKTIERVTKQRIHMEKVPTIADLRARKLELTRAALHEILAVGAGAAAGCATVSRLIATFTSSPRTTPPSSRLRFQTMP